MTITQLEYIIAIAESRSMQEAARRVFTSQPNLSGAVKALEDELGVVLFIRSRTGMNLTGEGRNFVRRARLVLEQYELLRSGYRRNKNVQQCEFHVSMQHYVFAVNAFIETTREYEDEHYRFSITETKTRAVIDNVKELHSEIGIIGFCSFNRRVLLKHIKEAGLEFHELLRTDTCIYVWKDHPLAHKSELSFADLEAYPCLVFSQGDESSLYFTEEGFDYRQHPRIIESSDRATSMECLIGLDGYSIGTGLLRDSTNNGQDFLAIPMKERENMIIGYVLRRGAVLTPPAQTYISHLKRLCGVSDPQSLPKEST